MRKNKLLLRVITITIVIGFLAALIIGISGALSEMKTAFANDLPNTYRLSSADSALIPKEDLKTLEITQVMNAKGRNPIALTIINEKYNLILYRIDLATEDDPAHLLHLEIEDATTSVNRAYTVAHRGHLYELDFLSQPVKPAKQIFLTLAGDSITPLTCNDTLVSFYLQCKNLSVRYAPKDVVDIYLSGAEGPMGIIKKVPVNVSFLKQGTVVHLLLMIPRSKEEYLPSQALDKMLKTGRPYCTDQ